MLKRIAVAALLAAPLFAAPASAQQSGLVTFRVLSPDTALDLAKATLDSCRKKGFQVAVAVVDRFGNTQVLLRDQFAGPHTPDTAAGKAWTAVSFRSDTLALVPNTEAGQPQSGARFLRNVVMLGGGRPVEAGGSIVGGIGVSGAPSGQDDDACAKDGIAAIEGKLL